MRYLAILVLMCAVLFGPGTVSAADFTIGYLQLEGDPRYGKRRLYARFPGQPLGRPYVGAEVALTEVKFHGAAVGATFTLARERGKDAAELAAVVDRLKSERGVHFFLLDAPADTVAELGELTRENDVLIFNVSAREDRLRQTQCQQHVLHVIPSYAMLSDALSQYLTFRKWREVLVLEGPTTDDQALAGAFRRSAKRYGLDLVDQRPFVLSNDPRQRNQNNVSLLTAGEDYQVVYVADTEGEFARGVAYQTVKPQLVVGTEGLAAAAWHWAWERHGAPQLENRFEKAAERPMTDFDWSAWIAVKAVADAVQRTGSLEFEALAAHVRGQDMILDGFKGNRLNFRPWNNQLRQPVLLVTHNWVVARAPLDGFLHPTNDMDTLGFDRPESECEF